LTDSYGRIGSDRSVLFYERGGLSIALNMGHERRVIRLGDDARTAKVLLSSRLDREGEKLNGAAELRPDEGVIIEAGAP
jgi:alpha-glucosidase